MQRRCAKTARALGNRGGEVIEQCPLMAHSGHPQVHRTCPLSGVKRTCFRRLASRHLYPGPPPPVPDAARMHPALLVFVNAVLALISIAALTGIWFS